MKSHLHKNQLLAWVILLLINFNFVAKIYVISNFYVNRIEIASKLCVKKNIKNNCCKGSCHLNNQLSKLDNEKETPNNTNNTRQQLKEIQPDIFLESSVCNVSNLRFIILRSNYVTFAQKTCSPFSNQCDHPPQFC